jgi:TPR repeat protein
LKLGKCYYDGEGVEEDRDEALEWYLEAANQGLAEAAYKVGEYYYWGIYVSKSLSEAERWFHTASYYGWKNAAQAYLDRIKSERGW